MHTKIYLRKFQKPHCYENEIFEQKKNPSLFNTQNSECNHLLQRHHFNFYNLKTSLKLFFIKISLKKRPRKKNEQDEDDEEKKYHLKKTTKRH